MKASDRLNLKFPKDFFKNYARDKPCLIRLAREVTGQPCGGEETTVLAHYTLPGYKATGSRKASLPDLCGAWACNVCHDICDGRAGAELMRSDQRDTIKRYHAEGVMRTLDALVKAGVLPNP